MATEVFSSGTTRTLFIERYVTGNGVQYRLTGIMRVTEPSGDSYMLPYEGDPFITSLKFDDVEFIDPVTTRRGPDASDVTLTAYSQDRDMRG